MAESTNRKRSRSPTDSDHQKTSKRVNVGSSSSGRTNGKRESSLDRDHDRDSGEKDPDMHDSVKSDTNGISAEPTKATDSKDPPPVPPAHISMRCLIVTQDASIIIGRAGAHVNEIRQKSGAKIVVSESIPGNPERILNVGGPLDAVSKAFGLIVRRINDEPFDVPSVPGSRAVTIKFMIPNSRMGSVIGKGGSKIKEIQEASGARLNASEGLLPGSTERILSVAGVADAIHIATYYIGNILIEANERNPTPAHANSSYRPSATAAPAPAPPRSRGPPPPTHNMAAAPAFNPYPQQQQPFAVPPAAAQMAQMEQKIYIPNDLVGCIIGKGGVKINEIRQMSQCVIKIMEPGAQNTGGAESERLVVITGQPHSIQLAVSMLYNRLEQEKQKQIQARATEGAQR